MASGSGPVPLSALRQRECGTDRRAGLQCAATRHFLSRQPALWKEEEVSSQLAKELGPECIDKAFAAAWQDDTRLLVGTKSNHLLQWDTTSGTLRSILLPSQPPRQHQIADSVWGDCGIHTVVVNPARDLVATGGDEPADCVILNLPDCSPHQTLVGHMDWLFGAAWVSDRHLVTGSRDQSVALWSIPEPGEGVPQAQYKGGGPGGLQRKFEGKVRDVKYDFDSCRLAALSTDGCIKLLDTTRNLRTIRTVKLTLAKELVCLEQRHDLLAVGSVGHVTLLDPRRRSAELHAITSPDLGMGVRSLQMTDNLLSFGTGRGKLFFYDLRAAAYLPTEQLPSQPGGDESGLIRGGLIGSVQEGAWRPQRHLQLGPGYVARNETFYDHFMGMDVKHACYAHTWDASRTRLFVCGGPLAFGLQGLYMAVWH